LEYLSVPLIAKLAPLYLLDACVLKQTSIARCSEILSWHGSLHFRSAEGSAPRLWRASCYWFKIWLI